MQQAQRVAAAGGRVVPVRERYGPGWGADPQGRARDLGSCAEPGHEVLAQFIASQGDGELGETFILPDGRELMRLERLYDRTDLSIFGPLELRGVVYGSREGQKIEFVPLDHRLQPLDHRLQLRESEFPYVLQDWCPVLDVEHAFARTAETMETILGPIPPVDGHRKTGERANKKQLATVGAVYTVAPEGAHGRRTGGGAVRR